MQLDRCGDALQVSILIAPSHHRQGIGRLALRLARRLVPGEVLVAEVLPENDASHALFTSAGYRRRQDGLYASQPSVAARQRG